MRRARAATAVAVGLALAATVVVPATLAPTGGPLGAAAAEAQEGPTLRRLAGPGRVETAVEVSRAAFPDGAEIALVASSRDAADALAGGPLAVVLDAPLLLTEPKEVPGALLDELARLDVGQVLVLGGSRAVANSVVTALRAKDLEVERVAGEDRVRTALAIADRLLEALGPDDDPGGTAPPRVFVASGRSFADALAVAPVAAASGSPVLLAEGSATAAVGTWLDEQEVTDLVVVGGSSVVAEDQVQQLEGDERTATRIAGADRYDTAAQVADLAVDEGASRDDVWVADGADFPDSLAAGPAVAAAGASFLLVDGDRPWETRAATDRLADWSPSSVTLVGGEAVIGSDAAWQLPTVVSGEGLPGGGFTLFPQRHLVAFYGSHKDPRLGVLGEQDPDAAFARLSDVAAQHEVFGRPIQPVFELIVDVATAGAGPDGDYSAPSTLEEVQPWLDAAHRHGVILLLDLQTGRTDFLTAARRYESLLRDPWVGLALDPEWRMDPGEIPAQTVGEVDAAEVNAVSEWLAAIVREERLPEKLFVLHQFQLRMLPDRAAIVGRPELGTVLHMDGQGSRAAKLSTYAAITREPGPWHMGFKLFYDEDPDMFAPADLVGLRPTIEFISYQ